MDNERSRVCGAVPRGVCMRYILHSAFCILHCHMGGPGTHAALADDALICEWKRRVVSAAPFEDRIVHHALCRGLQGL